MIQVSLNLLIFLYLGGMLGLVFGAWILSTWHRQQRETRAFRHVLRCNLCAFEFEDKTNSLLPRCPRCGSLNERYKLSRL